MWKALSWESRSFFVACQKHRNRKDLLIEKGSIGVGGNLISKFEQPVAMRSIPYSATFRQASQLPPEFKELHTGVV